VLHDSLSVISKNYHIALLSFEIYEVSKAVLLRKWVCYAVSLVHIQNWNRYRTLAHTNTS